MNFYPNGKPRSREIYEQKSGSVDNIRKTIGNLPLHVQRMAWHSENGHAEAAIINTLEDGGAERDDGGACSEDIVHQQDMFSAQAVGATNTEDMLHVIPTLVMRLRGLTLVIAVTHNALPIDLDA